MNVPTPLELARLKAERDRQIAQSILQQRQEQVSVHGLIEKSTNLIRCKLYECRYQMPHQKWQKTSAVNGLPNSNNNKQPFFKAKLCDKSLASAAAVS